MILGMSTASACHLSLSSREADWRQHINHRLQSDTLPQHPVWMVAVKCCRCPCRWSSHAGAYPTIVSLARKYLTTPATTVPCEPLFSVSGNIVSKKRASLSPGNVNKLVCLNNWLRDWDTTQTYRDYVYWAILHYWTVVKTEAFVCSNENKYLICMSYYYDMPLLLIC